MTEIIPNAMPTGIAILGNGVTVSAPETKPETKPGIKTVFVKHFNDLDEPYYTVTQITTNVTQITTNTDLNYNEFQSYHHEFGEIYWSNEWDEWIFSTIGHAEVPVAILIEISQKIIELDESMGDI